MYICDTHVRSYIITHMSKRSAIITICEVPPPINPSFSESGADSTRNAQPLNKCVCDHERTRGAGPGYNGITIVITPGWWCKTPP